MVDTFRTEQNAYTILCLHLTKQKTLYVFWHTNFAFSFDTNDQKMSPLSDYTCKTMRKVIKWRLLWQYFVNIKIDIFESANVKGHCLRWQAFVECFCVPFYSAPCYCRISFNLICHRIYWRRCALSTVDTSKTSIHKVNDANGLKRRQDERTNVVLYRLNQKIMRRARLLKWTEREGWTGKCYFICPFGYT